MDEFTKVATTAELPPGGSLLVDVAGIPVAIFNIDGHYYAIEDVCTHDGGPLVEGELIGYEIECPRHGAHFDVRTGKALTMPAFEPVPTYQVKVDGHDILLAAE